jgi:predicted lipid-binding transport protein (Tim44 family)
MSMDGNQSSIVTLFFLVAAVLVFIKLRSVLGRRTGDEAARFERYRAERAAAEAHAAKTDSKIVTLPRRDREQPSEQPAPRETDADRAQRMTQFAGGNATLAQGLIAIAKADHTFDPPEFLRGAKAAYETIVVAFADGNRATLKDLLSPDVLAGFSSALDDRAARKDTIEQSFVGIKGAEVTHAELHSGTAHVTVRFVSDLISATRNAAGEVTSGDPKRIKEVTDIWTFVRDTSATTPNWHLDSTQAAT